MNFEQSRFEKLWSDDNSRVIERVGFIRKNETETENEYLIFPTDFKKICKGANYQEIAKALKDRGILRPDNLGNATKLVKIGKFDTKPFRCYVIKEKIFTFDEVEETKSANA